MPNADRHSPSSRRVYIHFAIYLIAACALPISAKAENACKGTVYLTFDTGHMGVASLVAEVLHRQGVQATFEWQAARATSPARMCTAVLVNTTTSY